jgi:low affinity Fe/Cu permease
MKTSKISDWFSTLTRRVSTAAGSWQASLAAFLIVFTWIIGGFYFGFLNEIYQLFINSLTTVITFIMVFLIQGAQDRDTKAIHLKLNELLSSITKANEQLIDIENATDEQLEQARRDMEACKQSGPHANRKTEDQP